MATVTLQPFPYKSALAACMSRPYVTTMLSKRSRLVDGEFIPGIATLTSKKVALEFFNSSIPAFKEEFSGIDVPPMHPALIYSECALKVSNKYAAFPDGVYALACLAIYIAALYEQLEKPRRYPAEVIAGVREVLATFSVAPKDIDLAAPITDEEFIAEFTPEVRALVTLKPFEIDGVAMLWVYFSEEAINNPATAAGAGAFKGVVVYRTTYGLATGLLGQYLLQRESITADTKVPEGDYHRVFGGTTLRIWSFNHRLVISDLSNPNTGHYKFAGATREEFIYRFIPKETLLKILNHAGACLEVVIHDASAPVAKGKVRRSEDALVVLDYHSVYTSVFPEEVTESHRILRELEAANKNLLVTQSSWCKEWFSKETSCTAADGADAGIFVTRRDADLILWTSPEYDTRAETLKGVYQQTVAGYLDHFTKAEKSFTTAKEKLQGLLDERSCVEITQLSEKRQQALTVVAALRRADDIPADVQAWLTKCYKPRGKDTLEARKQFLRNAPLSVLLKFV